MKKYTILLGLLLCFHALFSQKTNDNQSSTGTVITCSDFHVTKPLSEMSLNLEVKAKKDIWEKMRESKDRENRSPQKFVHTAEENPTLYGNDPASIQTKMGDNPATTTKAPIKNWPGQQATGFRPQDPSGAAGPNHYIQAINGTPFRVYDKNTGANLLTANISSLWSPATTDEGDPIILYDKYADRWLITQFGTSSDRKIHMAVSKTADPLGQYYTYTFVSNQFPDYLKFGIWENGYYMTSNQGTQRVFCFERAQMIAGNPSARAISQTYTPGPDGGFFVPLPADADGGLPAPGTPCPFFSYSDNAWGSGAVDGVKIWNMTVTWGATPVATIVLKATVPTAAFDASYDSNWNDVSQPGTTQKLDGIGGVPTFRAQWRQWSGYNTIVMNWGVKISASQRSIKWVELRQNQTTGNWSLYQEGTYTPDNHSRWLGSISMDKNGSIALCYAKSSSTVYPSLCYAGRLATDPLGTMSFAETVAAAGTGSETSGNRFGDYSHTSMDPDDETFWHTGEYCLTSGTTTRVYSFKLPAPVTGPPASVAITSNDANNTICAGTSVTFTAVPTNGGTAPTYQWKVNGVNAGTGSTFTTTTLTSGQSVTCVMTSNLAGATNNPATSNAIVTTVNAIPSTPTVTSNSPVCAGSSINLSTPTVASATYAWTGPNSYTSTTQNPIIASSTTGMAGSYGLIVTANGCSSAAGNATVVVTASVTPSVTIAVTTGTNPTCAGTSVTFTATPTNGGTTPTYQWKVNGVNSGTGATFTSTSLTNGQSVTCVMTSNANCVSTPTATSNAIVMSITSTLAPSVAIAASSTTICNGSSVTFTATPTNGGTAPTYQWKIGGVNAGTGATFTSTTLANGNIITCVMTSNSACASPTTATSNSITMTVSSSITPTIAISTTNNPTCTGSSVTFTSNITNGGTTPTYQWKVSGVNVGTGASFTSSTLTNGAIVTCVLTSNNPCATPMSVTSNAITMSVNSSTTPTIAITASANPFCSGTSVTFSSNIAGGGSTPTYQWKVNGVNTATTANFTSSTLSNNDIVTCVLTSNSPCSTLPTATSNAITMSVSTSITPSIAIVASANPFCTGSSVTFTSSITNGGTAPTYQWKVNGVNTVTTPTFTSNTLNNSDLVTCVLTSNSSCTTTPVVTSNAITMTAQSTVSPSVAVALTNGTNPSCAGTSLTFTATPTNGGTTPTYQWKVNNVNAGTGSTFTSSTLNNNDVVICVMTSNSSCATTPTATSNATTISISAASATPSVVIALTSGTNPTCGGAAMTFTASSTNGGTLPSYQWKINGTNAGTGSTLTVSSPINGNVVSCVVTSNAPCLTASTATSNSIVIAVTTAVTPSVALAITAGSNPTCAGAAVTFTPTPTNGGINPTYQWVLDGAYTGITAATYSNSSLSNMSVVSCVMTSTAACVTTSSVVSNAITMLVSAAQTPTVSITSNNTSFCQGAAISFNATSTAGGTTPTYQWKVNNVNSGTGATFTSTTLNNNDVITCVLTSNANCVTSSTVNSNAITVSIISNVTPTISISSSSTSACVGTPVAFSASITNGGSSPLITWKLNGINVSNGLTYSNSSLTSLDVITSSLTSNASCVSNTTATSNALSVLINPNVTSSISTAITNGTNPTCQNTPVTFTATGTNGGSNPTYTWQVNGINAGTNSPTFTSSTLNNNDYVTCMMLSNAACVNSPYVSSTATYMNIIATPATPVITQSGTMLSSTAPSGNQWYLNGQPIIGQTNQTLTTMGNGNYYVIASNGTCSSTVSNTITYATWGTYDVQNEASHFVIYPNPSNGVFTCVFTSTEIAKYKVELYNAAGQIVYYEELKDFNGTYSKDFDVTSYGKGEYFLRIKDSKKNQMEKVIIY